MVKKLCFLLILFVSGTLQAQILRRPVAAPYLSLGAYGTHNSDAFSFSSNQAALAQANNVQAGVYAERRFLLEELSLYTAAVTLPTSSGNFGFTTGYYGFTDYNETQIGFAYARKLGKIVDAGVQFNYYGIKLNGYGSASAFNFEAGTILHLSEKLNAGFHVFNPAGGKIGKNEDEKLASVYAFGTGYEASDKFFVSTEIEKEENKPVTINAGIQYHFLPAISARAGISTATSTWYFGLGIKLKSLRIDVTSSYHPQLGVTPGILFLFTGKKKKD